MSSAAPQYQVGSVVLGYVGLVASWRRPAAPRASFSPMLVIQTCAETDEGAHAPATSITITSREGLAALREAIDEALKTPGDAA